MTETRSDVTTGGGDPQHCQSCGSELDAGIEYCGSCGTEVGTSSSSDHTPLKLIGGTSAVVSLIFLPIIFGPISMLAGFLLYERGEEQAGRAIGVGGFACMFVGMLLSLLFLASMT